MCQLKNLKYGVSAYAFSPCCLFLVPDFLPFEREGGI